MVKSGDGAIALEPGMEDSDKNNIKKENNDGERAAGNGQGRRAAEGVTGGVQPAADSVNTEKRAGRAEPDGVQVHKASTGDCEDPADIEWWR